MSDPVSENGTPWNQLPGATGGIRRNMTKRPTGTTGGNFFLDMVGGIIRAIMGNFLPGGSGVPGMPAGTNPLEFMSDLMGMRWQQVDDLQDSSQKFEGIQVYGALYMPNNMDPTSTKTRAPFTEKIHDGVGVTYQSNGITLHSRGLFKADAQCFYSWVVGAGDGCFMDIVVRAPNGLEFSRKPAISRSSGTITVFCSHTFGVPEPGYHVSVECATDESIIGATRAIRGGKGWTSLVVNKWSSEPE